MRIDFGGATVLNVTCSDNIAITLSFASDIRLLHQESKGSIVAFSRDFFYIWEV